MFTPLEVFIVLLLVWIAFAVAVLFFAVNFGVMTPAVLLQSSSCSSVNGGSMSGAVVGGPTVATSNASVQPRFARAAPVVNIPANTFAATSPPTVGESLFQTVRDAMMTSPPAPFSPRRRNNRPLSDGRATPTSPTVVQEPQRLFSATTGRRRKTMDQALPVNYAPVFEAIHARPLPPPTSTSSLQFAATPSLPPSEPTRGPSIDRFDVSAQSLTSWKVAEQKMAILIDGDCLGQLKGASSHDVVNVSKALLQQYHVPGENIYLLTSRPSIADVQKELAAAHVDPAQIAKMNIMSTSQDSVRNVFRVVIQRSKDFAQRTFLWFHYSGHGMLLGGAPVMQQQSRCGLQVGPAVYMTDTDLCQLLAMRLPRRARLFAMVDACNSGEAFALPYVLDGASKQWRPSHPDSDSAATTPECEVTCIGACQGDHCLDNQVTGPVIGYGGALTVAFLESAVATSSIDEPAKIIDTITPKFARLGQRPQLQSAFPVL